MKERAGRTSAEWATFAVASAILLALIAAIGVQLTEERSEAAPVVSVQGIRKVGVHHHVEVEVTNDGDTTAANVQVTAELVIDGETASADQTVDFLAGHEAEAVVFVFDDPPSDGELTVTVTSFSVP